MENEFKKVPVFENGMAQPVFPFTDGKTGDNYDAETSDIVRYCVYVETDFDMDGDGKRDLVKAFVQVPRAAAEGRYKAGTIYEARPYTAGTMVDAYDYLKEVQDKTYPPIDKEAMKNSPEPRKPEGCISSLEAALNADPSDWYYKDPGSGNYGYDDIDLYNYFLIRGFAVVESSGVGTRGSEGFEAVGTDFERDAFKAVVEWLHGDRRGFASKDGNIEIKADFSNGRIGMTGRSYAGTMPYAVATTGVKGLETIVPVAGIASWYEQQNQQGAQRYWPKEVLNFFLSYFCSSIFSDPEATPEHLEKVRAYQYQMAVDQIACGFDYDDELWGQGNYTLDFDKINCSALIVHGNNDENVSTKQFEMMYDSFVKAGENVKLILHQGYHMTPTMADKGYGFRIDGMMYEDILNRWWSHYLYGVENDAENFTQVLVQDNRDMSKWHHLDKWHTGRSVIISNNTSGEAVIDTDWDGAGVNPENYDEKMSLSSSNMNRRYETEPLKEEVTIQGTVEVDFTAALKDGDADAFFNGVNANDADTLTMKTGTESGHMDDVKLSVMLCDVADEPFDNLQAEDVERNRIPHRVIKEKSLVNGGNLDNFDEIELEMVNRRFNVISRSYIDLCNPESGYASETSKNSIELEKGDFHDYHIFLNAKHYTVDPGHRLVLVIGTEDPIECLIHKQYSVSLKEESIKAIVPVINDMAKEIQMNPTEK